MKPVDVVVATKLISVAISGITFEALAEALGISPSEAHQASKRLVRSGLFKDQHRRVPYPNRQALMEFWVHGLKYVFPGGAWQAVQGCPDLGGRTAAG